MLMELYEKKRAVVKSVLIVKNKQGLHVRPASELAKCANSFKSRIFLTYRNNCVNAKSILGILMLTAGKGAKIEVEAIGDDAQEAVDELLALASQEFGICY